MTWHTLICPRGEYSPLPLPCAHIYSSLKSQLKHDFFLDNFFGCPPGEKGLNAGFPIFFCVHPYPHLLLRSPQIKVLRGQGVGLVYHYIASSKHDAWHIENSQPSFTRE